MAMRLPPTIMTLRMLGVESLRSLMNRTRPEASAVMEILSFPWSTKVPSGMVTSPWRSTAQIRAFSSVMRLRSMSLSPSSLLPGATFSSTSSALSRRKVSRFRKAGKRRMRKISRAQVSSGLMLREMWNSSFKSRKSLSYSGFRTRAMVFLVPSFRATMQLRRLTSSLSVQAISRSARAAPASSSTEPAAPLPQRVATSSVSWSFLSTRSSLSMVTMSWPSAHSWDERVVPTLPWPTTMMNISLPPC